MLAIKDILMATGGQLLSGEMEAPEILHVSIDTRSIQRGELFLALKGQNHDGHHFIGQAIEKGARAIVGETNTMKHLFKSLPPGPHIIGVKESLKALQDMAAFQRSQFSLPMVAVTGSSGKSTTKDLLASILSQRFTVLKSPSNLNNHIGLPLSLLKLSSSHQVAVLEMGTNSFGEIRRLCKIARPTHGVITTVGSAHLEGFGSVRGVAWAKAELLYSLVPSGVAILNADDPWLMRVRGAFPCQLITFAIEKPAQFMALNIEYDQQGRGSFSLNREVRIEVPLMGRHNIYNALAAIATCSSLGLAYKEIQEGIKAFEPLPMRLREETFHDITILNDAYNANPDSMRAALESLHTRAVKGRRIAVLGDMLELGRDAREAHLQVGQVVASSNIDMLFTLGPLAQAIGEGARKAGFPTEAIFVGNSHQEIAKALGERLSPGDCFLIKGSRTTHMEKVLELLRNNSNALLSF